MRCSSWVIAASALILAICVEVEMEGEEGDSDPRRSNEHQGSDTADPTASSKQMEEIDFDKNMPEPERRMRMKTCLLIMREGVKRHPQIAENSVNEMMGQGSMSRVQARNYASFYMMMHCYQQVHEKHFEVIKNGELFEDAELQQLVLGDASTKKRAGDRLIKLWKSVVEEDANKQSQKQPQRGGSRDIGLQAPGMLYGIAVVVTVVLLICFYRMYSKSKFTKKGKKPQSITTATKKDKAGKSNTKKGR